MKQAIFALTFVAAFSSFALGTMYGDGAGYDGNGSYNNEAYGADALRSATSVKGGIYIGEKAGMSSYESSDNIVIGRGALRNTPNVSGSVAIGHGEMVGEEWNNDTTSINSKQLWISGTHNAFCVNPMKSGNITNTPLYYVNKTLHFNVDNVVFDRGGRSVGSSLFFTEGENSLEYDISESRNVFVQNVSSCNISIYGVFVLTVNGGVPIPESYSVNYEADSNVSNNRYNTNTNISLRVYKTGENEYSTERVLLFERKTSQGFEREIQYDYLTFKCVWDESKDELTTYTVLNPLIFEYGGGNSVITNKYTGFSSSPRIVERIDHSIIGEGSYNLVTSRAVAGSLKKIQSIDGTKWSDTILPLYPWINEHHWTELEFKNLRFEADKSQGFVESSRGLIPRSYVFKFDAKSSTNSNVWVTYEAEYSGKDEEVLNFITYDIYSSRQSCALKFYDKGNTIEFWNNASPVATPIYLTDYFKVKPSDDGSVDFIDQRISGNVLSSTKFVDDRLGGATFRFENGQFCVYTNGVRAGVLTFTLTP